MYTVIYAKYYSQARKRHRTRHGVTVVIVRASRGKKSPRYFATRVYILSALRPEIVRKRVLSRTNAAGWGEKKRVRGNQINGRARLNARNYGSARTAGRVGSVDPSGGRFFEHTFVSVFVVLKENDIIFNERCISLDVFIVYFYFFFSLAPKNERETAYVRSRRRHKICLRRTNFRAGRSQRLYCAIVLKTRRRIVLERETRACWAPPIPIHLHRDLTGDSGDDYGGRLRAYKTFYRHFTPNYLGYNFRNRFPDRWRYATSELAKHWYTPRAIHCRGRNATVASITVIARKVIDFFSSTVLTLKWPWKFRKNDNTRFCNFSNIN